MNDNHHRRTCMTHVCPSGEATETLCFASCSFNCVVTKGLAENPPTRYTICRKEISVVGLFAQPNARPYSYGYFRFFNLLKNGVHCSLYSRGEERSNFSPEGRQVEIVYCRKRSGTHPVSLSFPERMPCSRSLSANDPKGTRQTSLSVLNVFFVDSSKHCAICLTCSLAPYTESLSLSVHVCMSDGDDGRIYAWHKLTRDVSFCA